MKPETSVGSVFIRSNETFLMTFKKRLGFQVLIFVANCKKWLFHELFKPCLCSCYDTVLCVTKILQLMSDFVPKSIENSAANAQ